MEYTLKKEMRFMVNSFGFDSLLDFLTTAFRTSQFNLIAIVAFTLGVVNQAVHYIFGLETGLFIALIVLFIVEIISGIWASRIRYLGYTDLLKKKAKK